MCAVDWYQNVQVSLSQRHCSFIIILIILIIIIIIMLRRFNVFNLIARCVFVCMFFYCFCIFVMLLYVCMRLYLLSVLLNQHINEKSLK
jgi:hypothetical protein